MKELFGFLDGRCVKFHIREFSSKLRKTERAENREREREAAVIIALGK